MFRSAAFIRCVAVWLRILRARRSASATGGNPVAHVQVFFCDDAMRDESRDRIICAFHFGDFERFGIVVKSAGVGDLTSGFGVNRSAVENDFSFFALRNFVYRALLCDDRFDTTVARVRAEVKIRLSFECARQLGVGRARRFFVHAFPGRFRPGSLLLHRTVETSPINRNTRIACHVFNEIAGKSERIVKLERFLARQSRMVMLLKVASQL